MTLKSRMPPLLKIHRRVLVTARDNAADLAKDIRGSSFAMVASILRLIGVAEVVVHADLQSFRLNLSESAKIQLRLFERHQAGEHVELDGWLTNAPRMTESERDVMDQLPRVRTLLAECDAEAK